MLSYTGISRWLEKFLEQFYLISNNVIIQPVYLSKSKRHFKDEAISEMTKKRLLYILFKILHNKYTHLYSLTISK